MSTSFRAREEPGARRSEILRVLKAATAPMSIVAIADELAVHPNTVRFHLNVLVSDGRVEHVEPGQNRPGRPPLLFRAVRQMDRYGPRRYRLLAEILTTSLHAERDPGAKALAAGRAWGRELPAPAAHGDTIGADEAIDHLVGVLDELGFAPERREASGEIKVGLRHCPFLELAENQTTVVCPIHLGLMQGALATMGARVGVDRLEPFIEPDLCLAHLTVQ